MASDQTNAERKRIFSDDYIIYLYEPRNDSLLRWKDNYIIPNSNEYDYHSENLKIHKSKSYNTNSFAWNKQSIRSYEHASSNKRAKLNPITCHSATDVGNSLIFIGGMSGKRDSIQVVEMKKDFSRVQKLKDCQTTNAPCCRWAHSASYIAPLHAIVMFGGFDSTYNWNDVSLLFLSSDNSYGAWYKLNIDTLDVKALHSSTVRYVKLINKSLKIERNLCEVYLFGGQFCNGGPYEFNNDLIVIKFYDVIKPLDDYSSFNGSIIECDQLHIKIKDAFVSTKTIYFKDVVAPCPRSQNFAWIDYTNDSFWIYGGLDASTEFNDLWFLDFKSMKWSKCEYDKNNLYKPPCVKSLATHNFRINLNAHKFYYSSRQRKLLIMCSMDVTNTYGGWGVKSLINEENAKNKSDTLELLDMLALKNVYFVYCLDLRCMRWDILMDEGSKPKYKNIGSTLHRIGDSLWLIGGKDNQNEIKINRLNNIIGMRVPTMAISWDIERLLWIAHLKNDKNEKCLMQAVPKEIIVVILSYFKQNVW